MNLNPTGPLTNPLTNATPGLGISPPQLSTSFSNQSLPVEPGDASPFAETLRQTLQDVSLAQTSVSQQSLQLAQGNTDSIQEIAINAAKADLAFQFVLELRNRLIATYQDVMRMQI